VNASVTGQTKTAYTNSAGEFLIVDLDPGEVDLVATSSDSEAWGIKSVTIIADQEVDAGTITLTTGPPPPPFPDEDDE
jgi:hypothetical protein